MRRFTTMLLSAGAVLAATGLCHAVTMTANPATGAIPLGGGSVTFTVTNDTSAPLTILNQFAPTPSFGAGNSDITVTGASVSPNLTGTTLAPGSSASFTETFTSVNGGNVGGTAFFVLPAGVVYSQNLGGPFPVISAVSAVSTLEIGSAAPPPVVPEPASLLMLPTAIGGLLLMRRKA